MPLMIDWRAESDSVGEKKEWHAGTVGGTGFRQAEVHSNRAFINNCGAALEDI